ncbi:MAG TPA: sigma-70 family RNA polymerase sigma factor [Tepidisphaeraceae bacterium]|jgi:RNA polymerase sigma factor (sigma-70 family)|nr:sigma-70 family RNA polymerase sigma factor [Tepidisphaeraceae bacterium]
MDDRKLLEQYARQGSRPALEELIRRYVDTVHSAAIRQTRDANDAADVTQAVFLLFSKKAGRLGKDVVLAGWLLRATHFACLHLRRGEARRKRHEQKVAAMIPPTDKAGTTRHGTDPDWEKVAPLLDEAVAALAGSTRSAVVLRFFQNKSYKEVAERLQISEPTARQRVSRAVVQLREFFSKRGVVLSAGALEAVVIAHAVHPAPTGIAGAAASIGAKAATASARHAAIAKGAAIGMVPIAVKLLAAAAVFVVVTGLGSAGYRKLHPSHTVASGFDSAAPLASAADVMQPIRGRVLGPAGQPVEGAEVLLARPSTPVKVYGTAQDGLLSLKTAADGTFEFPPTPDATAVVVRADEGFAQMHVADLRNSRDVTLTAWGRVEGTLKIGSKPVANQTVSLFRNGGSLAVWNTWRVIHDARTRTDANGHYAFPRAIAFPTGTPGSLRVSLGDRDGNGGRSRDVRVAPGQSVRVDFGGTGRPVTGHILAAPNLPAFSGNLYREVLATTQPATAPAPKPDDALAAQSPVQILPVAINADGEFRIEDVPAGTYMLQLRAAAQGPGSDYPEDVAWAGAQVVVAEMAGGRNDEPLDMGGVAVILNKLIAIGEAAPEFSATDITGGSVRLANYRGKTLLLRFRYTAEDPAGIGLGALKAVYDRFGDDPRFAQVEVLLDGTPAGARQHRDAMELPWTIAVPGDAGLTGLIGKFRGTSSIPDVYANNATRLMLIGPDGKLVAKNFSAKSALSIIAAALPPGGPGTGPAVLVEHHAAEKSKPHAPFVTVPNPTADQNVARTGKFSVVDGKLGDYSGAPGVLNDGRLAGTADDPRASLFFDFGTLEGRFRLDLADATPIERISTYSWHKSHRGPQVYKVYGSDGAARDFDPAPKIGTDPTGHGWKLIAAVDTRPARGDDGGQYAASIGNVGGSLGTYKHLLFVAFVTETTDEWGQTFFNEVDVIRQAGGK